MLLFFPDFAVLNVLGDPLRIYEGDIGDSDTNMTCFVVSLNQPRTRDVVFLFMVSNMSTATPGVDFELSDANITITSEFADEEYYTCVYLTVIGDDDVEDDELIVIDIVPLSSLDRVELADGSNSIRATIVDNDGEFVINNEPLVESVYILHFAAQICLHEEFVYHTVMYEPYKLVNNINCGWAYICT